MNSLDTKSLPLTAAPPSVDDRMRLGKRLLIAGFSIAIIGLILYCAVLFSAGFAAEDPPYVRESLAVVGIGFLLWLYGAVKYINAASESDSCDELF